MLKRLNKGKNQCWPNMNIRTTSRRDITNLWSLYLNEPSTPVCFTYGGSERPMQYQRLGKHDTLMQCWASLADGGPALSQPWFNVPCLLGRDLAT